MNVLVCVIKLIFIGANLALIMAGKVSNASANANEARNYSAVILLKH